VDGVKGNEFERLLQPVTFSPDSRHFVYIARKGQAEFAVLDWRKQEDFSRFLSGVAFTGDSRHVGYVVKQDAGASVVLDGHRGEPFDQITSGLYFSGDCSTSPSRPPARREFVVVDGMKEPDFDSVGQLPLQRRLPAPGLRGRQNGRSFAVVDGTPCEEFDRVSGLSFSPNQKRTAYLAAIAPHKWLVVDGIKEPADGEIETYGFTPDSARVWFVERSARRSGWCSTIQGRRVRRPSGCSRSARRPTATLRRRTAKKARSWFGSLQMPGLTTSLGLAFVGDANRSRSTPGKATTSGACR
jgi:hypothetical protein